MASKKPKVKEATENRDPVADKEWIDGINPWLEPERRQLILEARQDRYLQLEKWRKGAGDDYLNKGLTPYVKK